MTQAEFEKEIEKIKTIYQEAYGLSDNEIAQAAWNALGGMESEVPGTLEEDLNMFGNYLEAQISSKNY